jgi:hypothetical protein
MIMKLGTEHVEGTAFTSRMNGNAMPFFLRGVPDPFQRFFDPEDILREGGSCK